jgi:hypothetical protein
MSSESNRSAAFSETLQFITSIKLEELEKQVRSYDTMYVMTKLTNKRHQRTAYYAHTKVIDEANALGHDSLERLEKLLHAVQTAPSAGAASSTLAVAGGLNLQNLSLWIRQAKTDPSISPTQIAEWSNAPRHTSAVARRALTMLSFSAVYLRSGWRARTLALRDQPPRPRPPGTGMGMSILKKASTRLDARNCMSNGSSTRLVCLQTPHLWRSSLLGSTWRSYSRQTARRP